MAGTRCFNTEYGEIKSNVRALGVQLIQLKINVTRFRYLFLFSSIGIINLTTGVIKCKSSMIGGECNRFLHESLLKIWDFFHECEKFRLFTSGA